MKDIEKRIKTNIVEVFRENQVAINGMGVFISNGKSSKVTIIIILSNATALARYNEKHVEKKIRDIVHRVDSLKSTAFTPALSVNTFLPNEYAWFSKLSELHNSLQPLLKEKMAIPDSFSIPQRFDTLNILYVFKNKEKLGRIHSEVFLNRVQELSEKLFSKEDYAKLKIHFNYYPPSRDSTPDDKALWLLVRPAINKIDTNAKQVRKHSLEDCIHLVLAFFKSHKEILAKGISPTSTNDIAALSFENALEEKNLALIMSCYRNYIDACREKTIRPIDFKIAAPPLAHFAALYANGETLGLYRAKFPGFVFDVVNYLKARMNDQEPNNFLLRLNMIRDSFG